MSFKLIVVDHRIALSWSSPFIGEITVADFNNLDVKGDADTVGLALPNARSGYLGSAMVFNNISLNPCPLVTFGGGNPTGASDDYAIAPGQVITIYLTDDSDADGKWSIIPYGNGQSNINAITFNGKSGVVVTNGDNTVNPTIVEPGGTVDVKTDESIGNLLDLNDTTVGGIICAKSVSPLVYKAVSISSSTNITVTNNSGIDGNPVISLSPTLTDLQQVAVGATIITDGKIEANELLINKVAFDEQGNITTPGTVTSGGVAGKSGLAKAFVTFTDTGSNCESAISIDDSFNVKGVTGAGGQYTINFEVPFDSATYTAVATLYLNKAPVKLTPYLVYIGVKQTHSLTVNCIDMQGNMLPPIAGVSVVIFAN